jgi:hypothetical protein
VPDLTCSMTKIGVMTFFLIRNRSRFVEARRNPPCYSVTPPAVSTSAACSTASRRFKTGKFAEG